MRNGFCRRLEFEFDSSKMSDVLIQTQNKSYVPRILEYYEKYVFCDREARQPFPRFAEPDVESRFELSIDIVDLFFLSFFFFLNLPPRPPRHLRDRRDGLHGRRDVPPRPSRQISGRALPRLQGRARSRARPDRGRARETRRIH